MLVSSANFERKYFDFGRNPITHLTPPNGGFKQHFI